MSAMKIVLIIGLSVIVIAAIVASVILIRQPQDIRSRAQTPACTPPSAPSNVVMEYPACPNDASCNFSLASCSWDAYAGAVNYKFKATEVDSNTVIKEETLASTQTKVDFTVTSNKTYRCEISVVTSCGTGPSGRDELLCAVEAIVNSPSPSPVSSPSATPTPTPTPTSAPAPLTCGTVGCANGSVACGTGLICVSASNGSSYCALPQYSAACQTSPDTKNCCTAPVASATPKPSVLPKTGTLDDLRLLIFAGFALLSLSGVSMAYLKIRQTTKH